MQYPITAWNTNQFLHFLGGKSKHVILFISINRGKRSVPATFHVGMNTSKRIVEKKSRVLRIRKKKICSHIGILVSFIYPNRSSITLSYVDGQRSFLAFTSCLPISYQVMFSREFSFYFFLFSCLFLFFQELWVLMQVHEKTIGRSCSLE